MKTQVEVKKIDEDCIEILGVRYDEDYCIEMNRCAISEIKNVNKSTFTLTKPLTPKRRVN